MTVTQKLSEVKELNEFSLNFKNLYLYGSGEVGRCIAEYLAKENICFKGFIVSKKEKMTDVMLQHPIYEISEIELNEELDGIIIAVGKKHKDDIIKSLKEYGYEKNIYIQNMYYMFDPPKQNKRFSDEAVKQIKKQGYFASYEDLENIGENYDTDKSTYIHNYLNKYEFFLQKYRTLDFNLLELGVFKGASLKMWSNYFNNAQIIGVDIDENCKQYAGENRKVIIADLSLEETLEDLKQYSPLVIIDDASHLWSHQIKALCLLFSSLPSGGLYILEDLETSFDGYGIYADAGISAYDVCSAIEEVITSSLPLRSENILKEEIECIAAQVEMVSFIHGSCILIKK